MSAPLSRSAFEAFACPKLFHEKYDVGFDDTSGPALRGQVFHDAAGRYIHSLVDASTDHDPTRAQQALEAALTAKPLAWPLMMDVEGLWSRFIESFRLNLDAFMLAEERQSDGAVTWMPDLVYAFPGTLRITDWKTYFVGMTEVEARDAFQTLFYLWQAMHVWPGFETYEMEFVFVRLGTSVRVSFTPVELERFADRVKLLAEQIRQARARDYWPPIPGAHCRYCSLACELADDPRRMPLRITNVADAEAALLRATVLLRHYEQIRAALDGFCELNGRVDANGVAAYHDQIVKRSFELADVVDVIASHGVDDLHSLPSIPISATSLRPILQTKKRAAMAADLRGKETVKHTDKFVIRRPKDPRVEPTPEEEEATACAVY